MPAQRYYADVRRKQADDKFGAAETGSEDIVYLEAFSGKKKKVYLTDKGNQVVKNTVLRLMKIENDIYTSWTKEEWETYVELTQRYLNMFKDRMKDL